MAFVELTATISGVASMDGAGPLVVPGIVELSSTIRATSFVTPKDTIVGGTAEARTIDSSLVYLAQSFYISSAYVLVGVALPMYRNGVPGQVVVELREVVNSLPGTITIAASTRNGNTLTTNTAGISYQFDFSVPLEAGKSYVVVVRCPAATGSNKVIVLGATTNIYASGGSFTSTDGGRTWTTYTKDLYLETDSATQSTLSRVGTTQDLITTLAAVSAIEAHLTFKPTEIMIPFAPETGMVETLQFLTDVLEKLDGSEQRVQVRQYPRRQYGMTLRLDGVERQWLDNVLSGRQAEDLYVPLWTQPTYLTSPASQYDTSLVVDPTTQALAEFREGNKLAVWSNSTTWDMVEIDTLGTGTITLVDELLLAGGYPVGTTVYPVVKVTCPRPPAGTIMGLTMEDVTLELITKDSESDIADASAWDSFKTLPYLKDLHLGSRIGYVYDAQTLDFNTGKTTQETRWAEGKQSRSLTRVCHDRQTAWDLRCLLYYLSGRWRSFYMPTYLAEVPSISLVGTTLTIGNVGYNQYAAGRTLVRIITSTADEVRTIISSVDLGTTEELTLDAVVGGTLVQVEFIYRVRLDNDDVALTQGDALGTMRADLSIRSVPIDVQDLDE
jgi:hypothetical protein